MAVEVRVAGPVVGVTIPRSWDAIVRLGSGLVFFKKAPIHVPTKAEVAAWSRFHNN